MMIQMQMRMNMRFVFMPMAVNMRKVVCLDTHVASLGRMLIDA